MLPTPVFHPNTADGTDCALVCIQMLLDTVAPEQGWTLERIKKVFNKKPDQGAWIQVFYPTLLEAGFDLTCIENWDDERFAHEGWSYLSSDVGADIAAAEQEGAPGFEFLQQKLLQAIYHPRMTRAVRPATFGDLRENLEKGKYVLCMVNSYALEGEEGFRGHEILVYGITDTDLVFHDPGGKLFPARPARIMSHTDFEPSWKDTAYPMLAVGQRA